MKETKVYEIETKVYSGSISQNSEARALYDAAGKVFWIPPFDTVVEVVSASKSVTNKIIPIAYQASGDYNSTNGRHKYYTCGGLLFQGRFFK